MFLMFILTFSSDMSKFVFLTDNNTSLKIKRAIIFFRIVQNPIPTNKPGVEPKRPPRPVNITQMVKLSPTVANQIMVSWAADYGRGYAMTVALVHKLTSSDLLQRLQKKGAKHADHTRALSKFLASI